MTGDDSDLRPAAGLGQGELVKLLAPVQLLLVDDNVGLMQALAGYFARADGFEVCGKAGSLAVALQLAQESQPNAILLDQQLPDGLGTDAVPVLRELCPQARLVLHSAAADVAHLARRAGVDGWAAKGGALPALANQLRHICRRSQL